MKYGARKIKAKRTRNENRIAWAKRMKLWNEEIMREIKRDPIIYIPTAPPVKKNRTLWQWLKG